MKNILGFALYGELAASTRYRLLQYKPRLIQYGINLELNYLLDDGYIKSRFQKLRLPIGNLLSGGIRRFSELARIKHYDAAILYCELYPLLPSWVEKKLLSIPYLYDWDDAFYLKYRTGNLGGLNKILGNKIDSLIKNSAAVSCGNQTLLSYAKNLNENVNYLPTVVDTNIYLPKPHLCKSIFTVGWVGSPSTEKYLRLLIEPLAKLGLESNVRFLVIGGTAPFIPNIEIVELRWEEISEVRLINTFDVGVMPLPDNEWTRGKCAFKLIQYMACGVPVIGSPVGANNNAIDSECGFFASNSTEWLAALREVRDSPKRRSQWGEAGRERVTKNYSLEFTVPIIAKTLLNLYK